MDAKEMDAKESARSWFCVLNNPEETYTGLPQDIAESVLDEWIRDKPSRSGAVAYCISANGTRHLHMVLEDSSKARFSALKNTYPRAHLEPTKGTKEQAEDYINKRGKYEEKGEQVLYIAKFGEIKGCQGARKDFDILEDMIEKGYRPEQIMRENMSYRRYEKYIRDAYYDKRKRETPFLRPIDCTWHVGCSGSGKSYTVKQMVDSGLQDDIYLLTDYDMGGLDRYNGEDILFMDEYRGQIKYSTLLMMLQGYMQQFHARYTNFYGLWTKVHITSVMPPEMVYQKMVNDYQDIDTLKQLLRRINRIVYHWKDETGYHKYEMLMDEYIDYDNLKERALKECSDFIAVTEQLEIPFGGVG
jgi:hypothetical protein